jgi:hypothetical protein
LEGLGVGSWDEHHACVYEKKSFARNLIHPRRAGVGVLGQTLIRYFEIVP